jgi:hypothetical protein
MAGTGAAAALLLLSVLFEAVAEAVVVATVLGTTIGVIVPADADADAAGADDVNALADLDDLDLRVLGLEFGAADPIVRTRTAAPALVAVGVTDGNEMTVGACRTTNAI